MRVLDEASAFVPLGIARSVATPKSTQFVDERAAESTPGWTFHGMAQLPSDVIVGASQPESPLVRDRAFALFGDMA